MQVEIVDRKLWINKCEEIIKTIYTRRQVIDAEYEKVWLEKKRLFFFKNKGKPPRKGTLFEDIYPTSYGSYTIYRMNEVIKTLKSEGTGSVLFDGKLCNYIDSWFK